MIAIITKCLPATLTKPARIVASAGRGRRIVLTNSFDGDDSHAAAAIALCNKMGWDGTLIAGGMPDETGQCFVFDDVMSKHYEIKVK